MGSRLTSRLVSRGHKVRVLTRDPSSAKAKLPYPGVEVFGKQQWAAAIQGADAVVNLAGEPIATRCACARAGVPRRLGCVQTCGTQRHQAVCGGPCHVTVPTWLCTCVRVRGVGRWTPEHKSAIKTSRVNTTKAVVVRTFPLGGGDATCCGEVGEAVWQAQQHPRA